jgi:CxxC-x17-CxxC domain-containing protein
MKEFKKGHRKGSYNPITPRSSAPSKGFRSAPKGESRPLEMHQATCVSCKKFCEVPFKPNGKKPVFCRDCFGMQDKENSGARSAYAKPSYSERTVIRTSVVPPAPNFKHEIEALNIKIDTLTRMVEALAPARKAAK